MPSPTLLVIIINLDPNIFSIGAFTLSWHGVFSAIGVLAGVTLGTRVAVQGGADEEKTNGMTLWAVVGGIVGARLFHVIDNWAYYAQNPLQIVMINEGGIAIYGAAVGGVLTGFLYARRIGLNVPAVADGGAVGLTIGQAIGRIGDVINGEHRGLPLEAPWAVAYTNPNTLGEEGVMVHPAVAYEMLWDLGMLGLLLYMGRRWAGSGVIFWAYVLLYGVGRFWLSFYRVDAIQAFGLRQAQLIAVVGVVLGLAMLVKMLLIDRVRPAAPSRGSS